ncbi:hypothetical protein KIN20_021035 [Parelaphostrongylus tenuis]|uniref:Uncharacterized protein n=1 Tax=Parelaphostrongylus tenuis TaxID=148309 RepID=A0AAD5MNB7_PARTN|nr:hypothetical protein KIN20_021035 [Parelaphostrongylus tenuis]
MPAIRWYNLIPDTIKTDCVTTQKGIDLDASNQMIQLDSGSDRNRLSNDVKKWCYTVIKRIITDCCST